MTEQEFLHDSLQERINMLLVNWDEHSRKSKSQKSSEVFDKMLKSEQSAEQFISLLPRREQDLVQDYINNLIHMFNTDESFLYQQGIFDGIQIMKFIETILFSSKGLKGTTPCTLKHLNN